MLQKSLHTYMSYLTLKLGCKIFKEQNKLYA